MLSLTAIGDVQADVAEVDQPGLGVHQRLAQLVRLELLVEHTGSVRLNPHDGDAALTGCEPPGGHGRVGQVDQHENTDDEGQAADDQEEDSPLRNDLGVDKGRAVWGSAMCRVRNRSPPTRDEAVGERGEGVEDESDPEDLLLPREPRRDDEREPGEGKRFEEAEQTSTNGETCKVLCRGDAHGDDTPDDDVDGDHFARLESLHQLRMSMSTIDRARRTKSAGKTETICPKKINDELPAGQPKTSPGSHCTHRRTAVRPSAGPVGCEGHPRSQAPPCRPRPC